MDPTLDELLLDGVVLPSNWLIFPYKFSVKKDVEAQSIGRLLDAIENLMKRLRVDGATGRTSAHSAGHVQCSRISRFSVART